MRAATRRLATSVSAACALLAVVACGSSCPSRQTPSPAVKDVTLEQAVERLAREALPRERVSSVYKARLAGIRGLVATDLAVVAERPGRLHIAVQSIFGQPTQVMATDGERVTLFDATGEAGPRYFAGPADDAALQALLPVPVGALDAVSLLLGRLPDQLTPKSIAVDPRAGVYRVDFVRGPSLSVRVTVDAGDDTLRSVEVSRRGTPLYAVTYDDPELLGGVRFPTKLRITVHTAGQTEELTLTADEPEVNGAPFPDEVFAITPPDGVPVGPLPGPGALGPF